MRPSLSCTIGQVGRVCSIPGTRVRVRPGTGGAGALVRRTLDPDPLNDQQARQSCGACHRARGWTGGPSPLFLGVIRAQKWPRPDRLRLVGCRWAGSSPRCWRARARIWWALRFRQGRAERGGLELARGCGRTAEARCRMRWPSPWWGLALPDPPVWSAASCGGFGHHDRRHTIGQPGEEHGPSIP